MRSILSMILMIQPAAVLAQSHQDPPIINKSQRSIRQEQKKVSQNILFMEKGIKRLTWLK